MGFHERAILAFGILLSGRVLSELYEIYDVPPNRTLITSEAWDFGILARQETVHRVDRGQLTTLPPVPAPRSDSELGEFWEAVLEA